MSVATRREAGEAVPAQAGTPSRGGAGRNLLFAALLLAAATLAPAQKKDAPPAAIEVTGVLADAKGALANKVVRVGPLDSKGNMLMIRSLTGATSGQGMNPQATTDAQGRFTVTVSRNLFRGYSDDALGLAAYTDLGGGRMSSSHESATVKFDPKQDKVDAGRVVLQPLKPRGSAR